MKLQKYKLTGYKEVEVDLGEIESISKEKAIEEYWEGNTDPQILSVYADLIKIDIE